MDSLSGQVSSGQSYPTALQGAGMGMQIFGKLNSGSGRQQASEFEAQQLEQNAGQQIAASQRSAIENERQGEIAASRALALAAASGGGASDPTVINLMARLSAEGKYRGMVDLYQGEEKARQLRMQAAASRYSGQLAMSNAKSSALATAIKGATSMYSKYGSDDPGMSMSMDPNGQGLPHYHDEVYG